MDRRFDAIDEQLSAGKQPTVPTIIPDHLQALKATIDQQIASLVSSIEAIDATVHGETDRLDAAVGSQATEVRELRDELSTHRTQLDQVTAALVTNEMDLHDLKETVSGHESDLDAAGAILSHLFSKTEEHEAQSQVVIEAFRELDPLVAAHRDQERVEQLRTRAARLNQLRGLCDACNEPVDVSQLRTPQCPSCNARFKEVMTRRGLFRDRMVLGTESEANRSAAMDWAADLWPEGDTLDSGPTTEGSRAVDSFVWVG